MNRPILSLLLFLVLASVASQPLPAAPADPAHNPIIWADVPDMSMIRVGRAKMRRNIKTVNTKAAESGMPQSR